jgi:hypothetical protein
MINDYREISFKWVDGDFLGRFYEYKDGVTVRNEKYTDVEKFKALIDVEECMMTPEQVNDDLGLPVTDKVLDNKEVHIETF